MKKSGILMPVSSLPSAYGIGALDSAAYHFVDQLQRGAQRIWQILPLGMTGYGNSPYQPLSLRSGNPYFLSLEELAENGWLYPDELPPREIHRDRVDYGWLYETRMHLLHLAFSRSGIAEDQAFLRFQQQEEIQDHALYMALKDRYHGAPWYEWPQPLRFRDEQALAQAKQELCEEMAFHAFTQYVFEQQWMKLKRRKAGLLVLAFLGFTFLWIGWVVSDADAADLADGYRWMFSNLSMINTILLPTMLAMLASRLCDMEIKGNTLKLLCTLEKKGTLFDVKLLTGGSFLILYVAAELLLLLAGGRLLGFGRPMEARHAVYFLLQNILILVLGLNPSIPIFLEFLFQQAEIFYCVINFLNTKDTGNGVFILASAGRTIIVDFFAVKEEVL